MPHDHEKLIQTSLKAGAPITQLISAETQRIYGIINEAAKEMKYSWYAWNRIEGLKKWGDSQFEEADDNQREPTAVLEWYLSDDATNSLLLLEDFHPDLQESQPHIIRRLRNIALQNLADRRLLLSQPFTHLPPELEKEVQSFEIPLPNRDDLEVIFKNIIEQFKLDKEHYDNNLEILDAAAGLTSMEAHLAFAKVAVEKGEITTKEIRLIVAEKEQVIRKSGYLEYHHPHEALKDVGGLDNLKDWLKRRGSAFSKYAQDYGLERPRGILMLGLPGTGKSLAAKAVANEWSFPLLRLDMGKIYGGIVGQSEANIRNALKTAEALAPCVLWIDEIEKGLSGAQSSGATDGGTTSRVLGTFLTWMQEKTAPVFVVATANDISQLPPELLRKGRVDEIFFVDLPDQQAREDILSIHLRRRKRERDFDAADLTKIAQTSAGFTGAELEEAIKEAMFHAFEAARQPTAEDVIQAIKATSPLSHTMSEIIQATRQWAKSRAVPACIRESEPLPQADKDNKTEKTPRLKHEAKNPFMK